MRSKPATLDGRQVFTLDQLAELLNLPRTGVLRAIRGGKLRAAKLRGRLYTTSEWVWQWVERSEVRRHPASEVNGASH